MFASAFILAENSPDPASQPMDHVTVSESHLLFLANFYRTSDFYRDGKVQNEYYVVLEAYIKFP